MAAILSIYSKELIHVEDMQEMQWNEEDSGNGAYVP